MDRLTGAMPEVWKELSVSRPLIYHLTNNVASNFSANVTLAVGASPVMSLHPSEARELASLADGILVNMGTPSDNSVLAMKAALSDVIPQEKPIVLDPVGYGATNFRKEIIDLFLNDYRFSVIKGNNGEISLLADGEGLLKGVDTLFSGDMDHAVVDLALKYSTIVVATGEVDHVSDGRTLIRIHGGDPILGKITASGCIAGSIICACSAACGDFLTGTQTALVAIGIAAERAAAGSSLPGSFPACFIDELSRLTPEELRDSGKRIFSLEVD